MLKEGFEHIYHYYRQEKAKNDAEQPSSQLNDF